MSGPRVRTSALRRTYTVAGEEVQALDGIDLDQPGASTTAVLGPSGSGKSTLLMILAGLERATSGTGHIGEVELTALTERGLLDLRATQVGVVVQRPDRNLLGYGTALDNVRFAQRAARRRGRELPDPAEVLEHVGLGRVMGSPADRLSGGERQRLSFAVGLASAPGVLLLDEPTSQLDEANRDVVAQLLLDLHARYRPTVITVTHDPVFADAFEHRIRLEAGRVLA
jgi:putative ABC transport system ATP-binding protein